MGETEKNQVNTYYIDVEWKVLRGEAKQEMGWGSYFALGSGRAPCGRDLDLVRRRHPVNIWRRALDRGQRGSQSEGAGIPPRGQWAWCGWEEKGDRTAGMTSDGPGLGTSLSENLPARLGSEGRL